MIQPLMVLLIAGFDMKMMNKKGSSMVEAALVLPIVILSVAAVFSLAVVLYEEVCLQAEYHLKIRESAMVNGKIRKGEAEFIRKVDFLMEGL